MRRTQADRIIVPLGVAGRVGLIGLISLIWLSAGLRGLAAAGMIGLPTAHAGLGSVEQGFLYDFSERSIRSNLPDYRGSVTSQRLLLRTAFGVTDQTDLILQFWSAKASTGNKSFEGLYGQAYGVGVKHDLGPYRGADIGVGGQILVLSTPDMVRQQVLDWTEYEVFIGGVAQRMTTFVPYGGLVYSGLLTTKFSELPAPKREGQISDEQPVGLFFGGKFQLGQRLTILTEFRLVHERAYSLNIAYRL